MSEFIKFETNAPATLGAVVEAVTRLSTYSEAQILDLVSAGKIKELFPFQPRRADECPADTVDESELVEASALPLSREQRAALIQSSMPSKPARSVKLGVRVPSATKKTYSEG
jgi:hypothetical protein